MAVPDTAKVERKYEVGHSDLIPPLKVLPKVERVGQPAHRTGDEVYFDTEDLRLAAHRISLRRCTGAADPGWHLTLPPRPNPIELTEPAGSDAREVPERLRDLVRVHVRDGVLIPVARVSTRCTALPMYDSADAVLAEFRDDRMDSETLLGDGLSLSWREWVIDSTEDHKDFLEAADALLAASGKYPSAQASKLARALGPSYPREPSAVKRPTRNGPAGAVLLAYMRRQVEAMKASDTGVRDETPDAVHQLRVSARSMRSALATYKSLIDGATADRLREELQWMALTVGQSRDVEVTRQRLKVVAAAEPSELLMGPVAQRIEEELGARSREARATGLKSLDSDRYFRLLDSLDAFLAEPPFTVTARKKAGKTIARLVAADLGRLHRAVRAAQETVDGPTADTALHEVRKCVKRLRYAAEAATVSHGKRARRLAAAAEQIQRILGDHQDSVLTRQVLRELGAKVFLEGANGFSYGRLHALEQQRGAEARAQFFRDWTRFRPKPLRAQ